MFKNKIKGTVIFFMLIILLFSFFSTGSAQKKPESITVMGGGMGGGWYTMGAIMADIFMKNGVKSSVEIGYGGTNLVMLDRGEAELGFSTSTLVPLARRGESPFDQKYEGVAAIGQFGGSFSHIFVFQDSGIDTIYDLKGKKIASQQPGSSNRISLDIILEAYGLTEEDVSISGSSQSEGAALIKDRHVDAFSAMAPELSATVTEVARSLPVKLLEFSEEAVVRAIEFNPGVYRNVLPANSYHNQPKDILGLGSTSALCVQKDMSEEEVYWITKILAENIKDLNSYAPLKNLTVEAMSQVSGVELHPGAKKYYDEILNK